MKNYQMEINGWNRNLSVDNLIYTKESESTNSKRGKCVEVIGLVWLDTVEGEEGWNPEGDCWFVAFARDSNADGIDDAIDCWDCYCQGISDVMRCKEAEKWLVEYMENH